MGMPSVYKYGNKGLVDRSGGFLVRVNWQELHATCHKANAVPQRCMAVDMTDEFGNFIPVTISSTMQSLHWIEIYPGSFPK